MRRHLFVMHGGVSGQAKQDFWEHGSRVNVKRTLQLLDTGAETVASACPFCMTMLGDWLKATEKVKVVRQLDLVEVLAESCGV